MAPKDKSNSPALLPRCITTRIQPSTSKSQLRFKSSLMLRMPRITSARQLKMLLGSTISTLSGGSRLRFYLLCTVFFASIIITLRIAGILDLRERLTMPEGSTRCNFTGVSVEESNSFSSSRFCHRRDAGCDWSCPDPYSTELYKVVQRNCSGFRFITLPADNGRIGHTMSQIHILLVFHRQLEALKSKLNIHRASVPHIPLIPTEKMSKTCRLFLQPPGQEVYLNQEAVEDACGISSPAITHISEWQEHAHELLDRNIHLKTWPMHHMHLQGNEDIYRRHFQVLPKWGCQARNTLLTVLQGNQSSSVKSFTSVHVRRTDYLSRVSREWGLPAMTPSFIDQLVETQAQKKRGTFFVLLTDDEYWCANRLKQRQDMKLLSIQSQELAFAVLSQCNASVVTYGSFGLWAGILSGGRMVRVVPGFEDMEEHDIQGVHEDLSFIEYISYL